MYFFKVFSVSWMMGTKQSKESIYLICRDRLIIYIFNPLGIFGLMRSFCVSMVSDDIVMIMLSRSSMMQLTV